MKYLRIVLFDLKYFNLQRFHLLSSGEPGQPDIERGPAADHGHRQVLRDRGGPVQQHQQTHPGYRHLPLPTHGQLGTYCKCT